MAVKIVDIDAEFTELEVVLEGKTYKVVHINKSLITNIQSLVDQADTEEKKAAVAYEQLALFLGGKAEDFFEVDLRKIKAVLKYVMESFGEDIVLSKKN